MILLFNFGFLDCEKSVDDLVNYNSLIFFFFEKKMYFNRSFFSLNGFSCFVFIQ